MGISSVVSLPVQSGGSLINCPAFFWCRKLAFTRETCYMFDVF